MALTESDKLFLAKVCDRAECYEDAVAYMKSYVESGAPMTANERTLFHGVYKSKMDASRLLWKRLKSRTALIEENVNKKMLVDNLKAKVAATLKKDCDEANQLIDKLLLPKAVNDEEKVHYLKMKADFLRYVTETLVNNPEEERNRVITEAKTYYMDALKMAEEKLHVADAVRIGLVLNCSVFYYEIVRDKGKATEIAKSAYEAAFQYLQKKPMEQRQQYLEAINLLQMLRDNLMVWDPSDEMSESDASSVESLTGEEERNENDE